MEMHQSESSGCHYYHGLEVGAVSVKWVRRHPNGEVATYVGRHEGNPRKKIDEIFREWGVNGESRIVVTGATARSLLNLPYRPEAECIERALSFRGLKPDMVLALGGGVVHVVHD